MSARTASEQMDGYSEEGWEGRGLQYRATLADLLSGCPLFVFTHQQATTNNDKLRAKRGVHGIWVEAEKDLVFLMPALGYGASSGSPVALAGASRDQSQEHHLEMQRGA